MIEIQNLNPNFKRIDKKLLIEVAGFVLKKEKVRKGVEISIVIISPEEIQKLNKNYRKKNKATDVLSFGSIDNFYSKEDFMLPEIIICPEEVKKNSEEYGISFKKELVKVVIHGILHLLDFDHEKGEEEEKAMFDRQDKYLSIFFK
ncbi:MAG: rRNA maturation RNase YbeY [Candidatus Pacebacteria bacterium]|nr:rRNA maturation RNase YbeY [Candidatus Paceibacterota bacterium]